jgi:hypothetical protein
MKRGEPPGWTPDLVPAVDRRVKERLRQRRKRERERYAEKARARDALKPKKPLRVPRQPRAPKPPRERRGRVGPRGMAMRHWRRTLVLILIRAGHTQTREISALLNTDPTSVAQSICELKRLGALPSQIGRTPIRAKA